MNYSFFSIAMPTVKPAIKPKKASSKRPKKVRVQPVREERSGVTDELRALYSLERSAATGPLLMIIPGKGRWLRTMSWIGAAGILVLVVIAVVFPYVHPIVTSPSLLLLRLGE